MKKIFLIILIASGMLVFKLHAGGKTSKPRQAASLPPPAAAKPDSDDDSDDEAGPRRRQTAQKAARRTWRSMFAVPPPPISDDDSDDASRELSRQLFTRKVTVADVKEQLSELRGTLASNIELALHNGERIRTQVDRTKKLNDDAQAFSTAAEELKETVASQQPFYCGLRGPLNDVFNGISFSLVTVAYAAILYDEYCSLHDDGQVTKIGFLRFAFQRFFSFKWSLTEAARAAWLVMIAKIVFDYWW